MSKRKAPMASDQLVALAERLSERGYKYAMLVVMAEDDEVTTETTDGTPLPSAVFMLRMAEHSLLAPDEEADDA